MKFNLSNLISGMFLVVFGYLMFQSIEEGDIAFTVIAVILIVIDLLSISFSKTGGVRK